MKKAEALLEAKKIDSAKIAYEKAINANPKHFYLKTQLKHVQYMVSIDSLVLQEQYKALAGTYGPRRFWAEDGKFYYKREGITKKELIAISENRFIGEVNEDFESMDRVYGLSVWTVGMDAYEL